MMPHIKKLYFKIFIGCDIKFFVRYLNILKRTTQKSITQIVLNDFLTAVATGRTDAERFDACKMLLDIYHNLKCRQHVAVIKIYSFLPKVASECYHLVVAAPWSTIVGSILDVFLFSVLQLLSLPHCATYGKRNSF